MALVVIALVGGALGAPRRVSASAHAPSVVASPAASGAALPEPVGQNDGVVDVFWRGASNSMMHDWYLPGAGWNGPVSLGGTLLSDPSPVAQGGGALDVFYEGIDGNLWHNWYLPGGGGGWYGPGSLRMGSLGGEPHAVSSQNDVIDVFWRGTDRGLWHAWYVGGWYGPQELAPGGSLSSDPVPVSTGNGDIDVFWRDDGGGLSDVTYRPASGWSSPVSLPMGTIGSASSAVAYANGNQLVGWSGQDGNLWYATAGDTTVSAPSYAGGGPLESTPEFASAAVGQVDGFWSGADGRAWYEYGSPSGSWSGAAPLPSGEIGSQPMPVAPAAGVLDVFWRGLDGGLWHAWGSNSGWAGPQELSPPGSVGAAPPECTAAQLDVSNVTLGAATGHAALALTFTNRSATSCTLTGYPGVALLNAAGQQVEQASRTPTGFMGGLAQGQSTPPVVTLGPGQAASALLEWTDSPQSGTCPSYNDVLVTPPNTAQSTKLAAPTYVCAGLQIHPVVPGTTGDQ